MKISMRRIAYRKMRYPTCGDWFGKKHLVILAAKMKNPKYCLLIFVHELIEAILCIDRGIRERDVTAFDKRYEANRREGDMSEPGDAPDCPYREEHRFATKIEKLLAKELGVDWEKYDQDISAL